MADIDTSNESEGRSPGEGASVDPAHYHVIVTTGETVKDLVAFDREGASSIYDDEVDALLAAGWRRERPALVDEAATFAHPATGLRAIVAVRPDDDPFCPVYQTAIRAFRAAIREHHRHRPRPAIPQGGPPPRPAADPPPPPGPSGGGGAGSAHDR